MVIPEVLGSIENTLFELADANLQTAKASMNLGKNMETHIAVMKEIKKGIKALRPTRTKMPTSFKKSASVKGCS